MWGGQKEFSGSVRRVQNVCHVILNSTTPLLLSYKWLTPKMRQFWGISLTSLPISSMCSISCKMRVSFFLFFKYKSNSGGIEAFRCAVDADSSCMSKSRWLLPVSTTLIVSTPLNSLSLSVRVSPRWWLLLSLLPEALNLEIVLKQGLQWKFWSQYGTS